MYVSDFTTERWRNNLFQTGKAHFLHSLDLIWIIIPSIVSTRFAKISLGLSEKQPPYILYNAMITVSQREFSKSNR